MKRAFLALIIACALCAPTSAASHQIRLLSDPSSVPTPRIVYSFAEQQELHLEGILLLLSSVDGAEWQLVIRP